MYHIFFQSENDRKLEKGSPPHPPGKFYEANKVIFPSGLSTRQRKIGIRKFKEGSFPSVILMGCTGTCMGMLSTSPR